MKKILQNIKRNIKSFDISPFHPGKVASLIIIIWGFNAVIFLGEIITFEKYGYFEGKYSFCTKTKKIQQVFIYVEDFIITKYSTISFFSILNSPIPENDVVLTTLVRGPPSL